MKQSKTRKLFLLLISVSLLIPQGVASADTKKVGRTNTPNVVNTILSGKGAPSASLGNNGDFYIDKVNLNFYGPKAKDLWPLPVSMRGPAGPSGVDGKNGSDGKNGVTTVAAGGGSSSPGAQGPAGPKGDTGPAGPKGDTGPAGPIGATGASGLPGPTGPAGPAGAQGDRGLQGPAGTSSAPAAQHGSVSFGNINSLGRLQTSEGTFGSFASGKSYLVHIFFEGYTLGGDIVPLALNVLGTGVTTYQSATSGTGYLDSQGVVKMSIHAIAIIDGNSFTGSSLTAVVTNYASYDGTTLITSGSYVASEIGSINGAI